MSWCLITLGELTKSTRPICYGVLKPGKMVKNGIPLVRVTDINKNYLDEKKIFKISEGLDEEFKRSRLKGGEILLSIQGTIGKVAIVPSNLHGANISRTIAVISPDDRLDNKYLYYYLRLLNDLNAFPTTGSTRASLNIGSLRNIKIPLPPLEEQKRIVAKLDAVFGEIDKAIEIETKQLDNYEVLQALVLNDLFFNNSTENFTLGDYIKFDKRNGSDKKLPYIGMDLIQSSNLKLLGNPSIPEKVSSTFCFNNKHVLYGRLRPYLEKVYLPDFDGICSTEIFCILPNEKLNRKYLAYWFLTQNVSDAINSTCTGTRMPRANMNEVLNFKIPIPSIERQIEITKACDLLFKNKFNIKQNLDKKLEELHKLRSSILTRELKSEAA